MGPRQWGAALLAVGGVAAAWDNVRRWGERCFLWEVRRWERGCGWRERRGRGRPAGYPVTRVASAALRLGQVGLQQGAQLLGGQLRSGTRAEVRDAAGVPFGHLLEHLAGEAAVAEPVPAVGGGEEARQRRPGGLRQLVLVGAGLVRHDLHQLVGGVV